MTTHIRASLYRAVSASGHDEGIELLIERINKYGERSSGLVVGELSENDLRVIRDAISAYLGEAE